ncbi:MAG TPA: hypothetical protein VGO62_05990, partial [Myxococcota bacterium]
PTQWVFRATFTLEPRADGGDVVFQQLVDIVVRSNVTFAGVVLGDVSNVQGGSVSHADTNSTSRTLTLALNDGATAFSFDLAATCDNEAPHTLRFSVDVATLRSTGSADATVVAVTP